MTAVLFAPMVAALMHYIPQTKYYRGKNYVNIHNHNFLND